MTKRDKITRDCIKQGDILLAETIKEYYNFFGIRSLLSEDDKLKRSNLIASKLALSCEYYLKGIVMQETTINLTDDMKELLMTELETDTLSEDEEIALIKGDNIASLIRENPNCYRGLDVLSRKNIIVNGKKGKAIYFLQEDLKKSKKTFLSINHDLISALDSLPAEIQRKIYLTYRKDLSKFELIAPFIPNTRKRFKLKLANSSTIARLKKTNLSILLCWLCRKHNISKISDFRYIQKCPNLLELSRTCLSKTEIKDAFPKGRYGVINNGNDFYSADTKTLYIFTSAIKRAIPEIIKNAVYINYERCIFPDNGSNMTIFNRNKDIIGIINFNRKNM